MDQNQRKKLEDQAQEGIFSDSEFADFGLSEN